LHDSAHENADDELYRKIHEPERLVVLGLVCLLYVGVFAVVHSSHVVTAVGWKLEETDKD
jgi:hypothetical protein